MNRDSGLNFFLGDRLRDELDGAFFLNLVCFRELELDPELIFELTEGVECLYH